MLTEIERAAARRRLSRRKGSARQPPAPDLAEGTDTLGQIEHIVILMMENHSYDNYLGMLRNEAGFTLDDQGNPVETNPAADGTQVPLKHFDGTVQHPKVPTQSWHASHIQYADCACTGFVRSVEETLPGLDATIPMSYWTKEDLPFYYGLATTFPLATRWHCSCLGPTFPNRRFLISGTAHGLIDDLPFNMIDRPASGTIFDLLEAHGISWLNYHQLSPARTGWRRLSHAHGLNFLRLLGAFAAAVFPRLIPRVTAKLQVTADLYPLGFFRSVRHLRPVGQFWSDAAGGTLPSVSIVDPDFGCSSEENPQDILVGEAFAAQVINAVMAGKGWPKTLLIWLYDEHGGYYDHVCPPKAVPPDDVPGRNPLDHFPLRLLRSTKFGREIARADDGPDTYEVYGFRVPAVIVSPYAKPGPGAEQEPDGEQEPGTKQGYVTDEVYDHTSVLKLIERKWNLPPLTERDNVAKDFVDDVLDLNSPPAFLTPPPLPAPARP
jgi:phospholipase C